MPLATPLPVEEAYPLPASELPAMDIQDSAYPAPVDGAEGGGTSFWQGIVAFFSNLFAWMNPTSMVQPISAVGDSKRTTSGASRKKIERRAMPAPAERHNQRAKPQPR